MSGRISLYHKALLAWRAELERMRDAALKDKRMRLREAMCRKLEEMVGPEYSIDFDEDEPEDLTLEAMVDDLNFLGFRTTSGEIKIVLLLPCPNCEYKMTSWPLTKLSDIGEELLKLELTGKLSNHECSDQT